jgi:hypothetical protein
MYAQDELAENDLKYLDGFLKECKAKQASYVREIERRDNGRYQATLISVHGDTVLIGEYSDKTCQVPHGRFVYFHENGLVESMGYYNSSRKVGTWKRFKKDGASKPFIKYPGQVPDELYESNNASASTDTLSEEGVAGGSAPTVNTTDQDSNTGESATEEKRYPVLKEGVELEVQSAGMPSKKVVVASNSTQTAAPKPQLMKEVGSGQAPVGPGTGSSMIRGVPAVW